VNHERGLGLAAFRFGLPDVLVGLDARKLIGGGVFSLLAI
jgi:hypothetical protein